MSEPHIIDLRSDTVTQPTPAMRQAMAEAELGDDVYGEDSTVRRLEEMAAERTGKEAAVLVASGTMANLTSLLVHCGRGDEAGAGGLGGTLAVLGRASRVRGARGSLGMGRRLPAARAQPEAFVSRPDARVDPAARH